MAQIGTTEYNTLEEAFTAANDGETIVVLANSSGNGIKVPQGKFTIGLTVNFGGYTYTVDGDLVGSTGTETQAFQLLKDNNITFQNGTITSEKAKILVQNYSNLTLDNMTLTLNNPDYSAAYTLSNNNGNIQATGANSGRGALINGGATLTLDNVTVYGQQIGAFINNGNLVMEDGATLSSDYMGVYSDVTAANSITMNGGTISGTTVGTVMNTGSITMNDGTIANTANGGQAVFYNSANTFTMNGGTVTSQNEGIRLQTGAVATLNDGTGNGDSYGVVLSVTSPSATLNLAGGTINSDGIGVSNNGNTTAADATTINITDGQINAEIGIYHPGMGNVTISGGEITAGTGIVMRNGKLVINDGTIHATGAAQPYDFHDSGSSNTGDALQIESSNYGEHIGETFNGETYAGTEVIINYGIFISDNAKAVASYINSDDETQTSDGTERRLNFISNGWYSNVIPDDYCAEGVEPDPNERADTPDNRAPYTIKTHSTVVEAIINNSGKEVEGYYTIDGVKHDKPVKGINIIRYTDNTSEKVILR